MTSFPGSNDNFRAHPGSNLFPHMFECLFNGYRKKRIFTSPKCIIIYILGIAQDENPNQLRCLGDDYHSNFVSFEMA